MPKQKSTRGGRRENQTGRPRLPTEKKRVKVAITMTREHYEATREGRSAIVEQALCKLLGENLNSHNTKKMERRKEHKPKVTFDLIVEDPNTGNEIARYKSEGECQPEDYDAVNRIAQAQEGTLFAHAENAVWG